MNAEVEQQARTRNRWVGGILVGFFVMLTVNAVFVVLASSSPPRLELEDYYEAGIAYQKTIDEAKEAKKLRWKVDVSVCPEGLLGGTCDVQVRLLAPEGGRVEGLTGTVHLVRPNDPSLDRDAELVVTGQGPEHRLRTQFFLGATGLYRVEVRLHHPGGPTWVEQLRVVVPAV